MCGRFMLESDPEEIMLRFGLERSPDNPGAGAEVTQGDLGLVIARITESRLPVRMSFGLPPPGGYGWTRPMVNARAETVHEKPAFRGLFRKRRCIVPATCFIENGRETGPFRFTAEAGEHMGLAGIWQTTGRDRNGKLTCAFAVITAPAGELVERGPPPDAGDTRPRGRGDLAGPGVGPGGAPEDAQERGAGGHGRVRLEIIRR